jgi:hypothetical protein
LNESLNSATERVAIAFVIKQERLQGRVARDTRGRGAGDVESDGRVIEIKAFSGSWRSGVLYFTSPQLREGERNADYYVYIVENIGQGDPSKFAMSVLHGEDLRRLFASAKPHRSYVAVRAADKARLQRLGEAETGERADDESRREELVSPKRVAQRKAKPIRDTTTGTEYSSMYRAGKALHKLVGGDIENRFVWYQILRAFPGRFQTKNTDGEWVSLDDPSVPKGTTTRGS